MPGAALPLAVCVAGPTAAGKTALALALAERLPLEVISVDSAMVYRRMDIGTAKPDAGERTRVPHHLIDIREPWESYSAGEFRRDALECARACLGRGRLPLFVGGTLLYFRALREGLAPLPRADAAVRAALDARARQLGWPALHAELERIDPEAAARIEPGDRQRIQRALEVFELSGEPISAIQRRAAPPPGLRFVSVALLPGDRNALYRRIEARLDQMFAAGLVAEVESLRSLPGMHAGLPAMRAVGYRQVWACLAGQISLEEARRRAQVASRRYAKRQLTWLRGEPPDLALVIDDSGAADRLAGELAGFLAQRGDPGANSGFSG